jgi:hypothetical protein
MSEKNYLVRCSKSRCGHIHAESLRVWVRDKDSPLDSKTSTCPLCGCDSVYHLKRGKRGGLVNAGFSSQAEWMTAPQECEVSP